MRMVKTILGLLSIPLTGGIVALACGGSASESPWPIEPDSPVLGPAGEDGKPGPLAPVPDAGSDAAPNVEP